MNEMYNMGIVTHNYGVIFVLSVIFINFLFLMRAKEIKKYTRTMRLFNPIAGTAVGFVIFTGVIMMAAKHLDFTIENIMMILFAISLIVLEAKRASKLKWTDPRVKDALQNYKKEAIKILKIEVFLTLSISLWMWI